MIEQGFQTNAAFSERLLSSIIELIIIVVFLWIIRTIFRLIIRAFKGIIHLFTGKRKNALESEDWLTRAQAKQEIRFQNSLPPLLSNQKLQKKRKRLFKRKGEGETWYPSGWTLNQETGLWEPPDYIKKEDTTYHYTKENIPKDETPGENQQTHFHHEDTSFKVGKTEYTGPQAASKEQNTTVKEEARKTAQTAAAGPRIIYTYSKPELKIEDMDQATGEELDFKTAYQRKPLFTRNEWQNYKKLRDIAEVRGFVICPKVRLFDLVEPRHDKKRKLTYRYKIQAKHVDFVICDKDMNIKAVLELVDSSHYDPDRIKRDDFVNTILLSTGYTVIHTKYIENSIFDLI